MVVAGRPLAVMSEMKVSQEDGRTRGGAWRGLAAGTASRFMANRALSRGAKTNGAAEVSGSRDAAAAAATTAATARRATTAAHHHHHRLFAAATACGSSSRCSGFPFLKSGFRKKHEETGRTLDCARLRIFGTVLKSQNNTVSQ